jgi:hypothetical protein
MGTERFWGLDFESTSGDTIGSRLELVQSMADVALRITQSLYLPRVPVLELYANKIQ